MFSGQLPKLAKLNGKIIREAKGGEPLGKNRGKRGERGQGSRRNGSRCKEKIDG